MSNKIIIGNIVSFVGGILFFLSSRFKKQKHICAMQAIECAVTGTAALILGGFLGAITTYVAGVRNVLGVWKLNGIWCNVSSLVIIFIMTIINYNSLQDLIPFVATLIYTIFLSFKSAKMTKIGIIPNSVLWLLYGIFNNMYINCLFNIINILSCSFDLKNKNYED